MPLFEYQCNNCENKFELLQRTNDAKKSPKCPICQTQDITKRLSGFAARGTQKQSLIDNST